MSMEPIEHYEECDGTYDKAEHKCWCDYFDDRLADEHLDDDEVV